MTTIIILLVAGLIDLLSFPLRFLVADFAWDTLSPMFR